MRIDLHTKVPQAAENEKPAGRTPASADAASSRPELGGDHARLSLDRQRLQALEAGVNRLPEVRQEKVQALRSAMQKGSYDVSSEQIADAMVSGMLAGSNQIR